MTWEIFISLKALTNPNHFSKFADYVEDKKNSGYSPIVVFVAVQAQQKN